MERPRVGVEGGGGGRDIDSCFAFTHMFLFIH